MTFAPPLVRSPQTCVKESPDALDPILVYDGTPLDGFGECSVRTVNPRERQA